MNEAKRPSRRDRTQMRMLAHERRVITSLRRVNDDVSEHSVHLTPRSLLRTNTPPPRLSFVRGHQLLELSSVHGERGVTRGVRECA